MTREETKQAIQVMQAYVDGAEIELRIGTDDSWGPPPGPNWNWEQCEYRVKPKPKLELRVGAWYELQSGIVMKCRKILGAEFMDDSGWMAQKDAITREVRVLPVEEL